MAERWFLLRTKGAQEQTAQRALAALRFESYFPQISRRIRKAGKRVYRTFPLFPQYLFLRLTLGEQTLQEARRAKGVRGVVRVGDHYALVPPSVIAFLAERVATPVPLEPAALSPNARIRVLEGPFAGLEGVFLRESGIDRILVLLEVLGKATSVHLPELAVEALRP